MWHKRSFDSFLWILQVNTFKLSLLFYINSFWHHFLLEYDLLTKAASHTPRNLRSWRAHAHLHVHFLLTVICILIIRRPHEKQWSTLPPKSTFTYIYIFIDPLPGEENLFFCSRKAARNLTLKHSRRTLQISFLVCNLSPKRIMLNRLPCMKTDEI